MQPNREQWNDWERSALRTLAIGVREARERAGMSQRALADAARVDRGQIANLESNANAETSSRTTELPRIGLVVRLALALRLPPLELLYPGLPDGSVEVLPDVTCTSMEAAQWFSGEVSSDQLPDSLPVTDTQRTVKARKLRDIRRQIEFNKQVLFADDVSESARQTANIVLMSFTKQAQELEAEMRREGLTVRG
ncbi:helix-turn-helix transcriptional regulator [Nocardia gipuzkoensis]|uniref:helix-turn-helix transcriptional regulator n=1 Tax=Nocardia gipuzkoensis TaxID=2749991 RepID=UPI00237E485C|nr:helix-turn-helix transcriptional regulator [Nocardia gipuzkoensis]MDE1668828.1 helix-turn-helix transcriptional regulator [Nocardia gipuzkoensis]